jgi:cell division protein FtsN
MSEQDRIELVFSRTRFAVILATALVTGCGLLAAGWFAGIEAGRSSTTAGIQQAAPSTPVSPPAAVASLSVVSLSARFARFNDTSGAQPGADQQYIVQAGSFLAAAEAQQLTSDLTQRGYSAETVARRDSDGRSWLIVRVGPYRDRATAAQAADELERLTHEAPIIRLRGRLQED